MTDNQKRLLEQFETTSYVSSKYMKKAVADIELAKYAVDVQRPEPDMVYGWVDGEWVIIGQLPDQGVGILAYGFVYIEEDSNPDELTVEEFEKYLTSVQLQEGITDYSILTSESRVGRPIFWLCCTKPLVSVKQTEPLLDDNISLTQYNTIERFEDGKLQTLYCYNIGPQVIPEPDEIEDPVIDFKFLVTVQQ